MSYPPEQQRRERPRLPTSVNVLVWLIVGIIVVVALIVLLSIGVSADSGGSSG